MFTGLVLTEKGISMLNDMLNGEQLTFTCIKMGDGTKPSDVTKLTDLVNTKQVLPIARNSTIDNSTTLIGANLFGTDVKEGFYWKEVGIFAKGYDDVEYLFSYDNADSQASYIPAGGAVTEQLIDLNIALGNMDNVSIEINSSLAYATLEELNKQISTLNNSLTTIINTNKTSIEAALKTHTDNKSNPHGVTKSQVGLGSVENYGIATDAEAKAGSSNAKYMTPARVKDALTAMGAITDGNVIIKIGNSQPSAQSGKTIIWINTGS